MCFLFFLSVVGTLARPHYFFIAKKLYYIFLGIVGSVQKEALLC